MSLRTPLCDLFDVELPIFLAGMGGASTPALAAAVSEAGGLGILGAAASAPDLLRDQIAEIRRLTDRPFGVDTLLPASVRRQQPKGATPSSGPSPMDQLAEYQAFARDFMDREGLASPTPAAARAPTAPSPTKEGTRTSGGGGMFSQDFFDAQMEVIIDARVPVYAAGLGDPGPYLDRLREGGAKVMGVVGAVRHARKLVATGVDAIVAQGHDAGGHNSPVGTMALIPQVVDAAAPIPVLGAGGITDGRGVAAALMLGAQGAWVGTAFLATHEAGIHDFQKKAIVESSEENTMVSRAVTGKPARLIRNRWSQAFADAGREPLPMPFQSIVAGPVLMAATLAHRGDIVPGFAGQGIGMIDDVRPAAEVLRELARGAEEQLARAASFVGR